MMVATLHQRSQSHTLGSNIPPGPPNLGDPGLIIGVGSYNPCVDAGLSARATCQEASLPSIPPMHLGQWGTCGTVGIPLQATLRGSARLFLTDCPPRRRRDTSSSGEFRFKPGSANERRDAENDRRGKVSPSLAMGELWFLRFIDFNRHDVK